MTRTDRPLVVEPLYASTRDASWYKKPDVRTVKVWHIGTEMDTAACAPGPGFHSGVVILITFGYLPAEQIFDDLRCRRPGCRVHWAKVPSKPRRGTT